MRLERPADGIALYEGFVDGECKSGRGERDTQEDEALIESEWMTSIQRRSASTFIESGVDMSRVRRCSLDREDAKAW